MTVGYAQNRIEVSANFDVPNKKLSVEQTIRYQNTSNDTLHDIYLHDWINSYSSKKTPLAIRFAEEFNSKIHLAKKDERGFTNLASISTLENSPLKFTRLEEQVDVIKVTLSKPLLPNENYNIKLSYNLILPSDRFTGYGISNSDEIKLKYWYILPAVYDGEWQYYSNKNLDDLYIPNSEIKLELEYPRYYALISELNTSKIENKNTTQKVILEGNNRINTFLLLTKEPKYSYILTNEYTVITDLEGKNLSETQKTIICDKVNSFLTKNLGRYPHENFLISELEYNKDPLYGLNQLPDFIRPYPDNFQYELKLIKTALRVYLDNTVFVNPRKDYWLKEGLQTYFLIRYIEENYPDMKLLGGLADIWGIRSFHAADLFFNDQYNLFFMQMARTNRDQALTLPKDSLLKFNSNIANKYKAGIGLLYLDDFVGDEVIHSSITSFLNNAPNQPKSSKVFEDFVRQNTTKDVDWFFGTYLNTRDRIDFKFKNVKRTKDSVTFNLKNKRKNDMPISLFLMDEDSIVSKLWVENVKDKKSITLPRKGVSKLVLNYDYKVPELNLRNNSQSIKGLMINSKPWQVKLIKDLEDPLFNQLFIMPIIEYRNIYDGLTLGLKLYNKTVLRKPLSYRIAPQYSINSKTITGSGLFKYMKEIQGKDLYNVSYGISGGYSSFAEDAFVTRISPSIVLRFRDNDNFRSNKRSKLTFRYLDISRTQEDDHIELTEDPDYGVFNIRFSKSNAGLIKFNHFNTDFQLSKDFGKLAVMYEYRKLTENNRQFNLRFFAGTFLYNNTDSTSDYFSFALDRPSDYLFDYDYLGRSEDTGLFSQQIIIAEGGFKSMMPTEYANQWMTTLNGSASIWKYVEAYGDIGFIKNKGFKSEFVYDAGIRLNLLTDYFELYFPVYSNLGWEIAQSHYADKIRFVITVDPATLAGLFRRKWY